MIRTAGLELAVTCRNVYLSLSAHTTGSMHFASFGEVPPSRVLCLVLLFPGDVGFPTALGGLRGLARIDGKFLLPLPLLGKRKEVDLSRVRWERRSPPYGKFRQRSWAL